MNNDFKLINDCCLNAFKSIDNNSIDCIITDLPYYKVVKDDFDNQWDNFDSYLNFINKCIIECNRVLKKDGSIFLFTSRQANRHICYLLDKYFIEQRIIIWVRKRAFNNTRGRALSSSYEPIAYYSKSNKPTFNNIKLKIDTNRSEYINGILKDGITMSDVWSDIHALPHNSKEKLNHPTQKPLKLMDRIITQFTNENDLILDFCMGTGTTGISALNHNRKFIGIEKDVNYFNICKERFDKKLEK